MVCAHAHGTSCVAADSWRATLTVLCRGAHMREHVLVVGVMHVDVTPRDQPLQLGLHGSAITRCLSTVSHQHNACASMHAD